MIFDVINSVMDSLSVRYWFVRADLTTETPTLFIIYDLYDNAVDFGDGEETATRYTVTFHLYGQVPTDVDDLYRRMCRALKNAGFTRAGGSYSSTDDFPEYYRRSVDFYFISENEEEI